MDTQTRAYLQEQAEARIQDDLSGTPEAFARHLDRIHQRPDGDFEQRAPDGNWYPYTPRWLSLWRT